MSIPKQKISAYIKDNPGCKLLDVLNVFAPEQQSQLRASTFALIAFMADDGDLIWCNGGLYVGTVAAVVKIKRELGVTQ